MAAAGARTARGNTCRAENKKRLGRHTRLQPATKTLFYSCIMHGLIAKEIIMEAERLNSLQSLLDDLAVRATELRRYL